MTRDLETIRNPERTVGVTRLNGDEDHVTTIRFNYLKQAVDILEALDYGDRDYLEVCSLGPKSGDQSPAFVLQPEDNQQDAVIVAPMVEGSE